MPPQRNPRSLANLKRGGPGRPKITPVERDWRSWAKGVIESEEYRASALHRILAGQAPHLERMAVEQVLGKPTERVELTGAEGAPLRLLEVRLAAADGRAAD